MLLPSVELSQRDSSNEGHNICFKGEIWKIILKLSLTPLLIWGTATDLITPGLRKYPPHRTGPDCHQRGTNIQRVRSLPSFSFCLEHVILEIQIIFSLCNINMV